MVERVQYLRDHMNHTSSFQMPYPIIPPVWYMDHKLLKGHLVLKVEPCPQYTKASIRSEAPVGSLNASCFCRVLLKETSV